MKPPSSFFIVELSLFHTKLKLIFLYYTFLTFLELHPYYAQIQGQMGISGAEWCDFVIFTKKGISIERVLFDPLYWQELEGKLLYYYCEHFIKFAIVEGL